MSTLQYQFDPSLNSQEQDRIKEFIENAFQTGEIISCSCATIEAWVYPTIPPDFQVSFSCSCDAMRPLFSSTPETE